MKKNKKLNTILFIIGATLVNILLILIIFFTLMVILSKLQIPDKTMSILFFVVFIGSIIATFIIYQQVIKFITSKIDMETYFHPLFRTRNRNESDSSDPNGE